jgi:hypothetical protein
MIWHYKGGNCSLLEEELQFANSERDDLKDALAAVIDIAKPAVSSKGWAKRKDNVIFHTRFGGRAF